jgi:hypothetical protein
MTLQNERFEELLARHLAAELEPQRGRAAAAFKAQLAAEAAEREARQIAGGSRKQVSWARREVSGRTVWLWTGVPSLVAACLAIVVTLSLVERPKVTRSGRDDEGIASTQSGNSGSLVKDSGVHSGDGINLVNRYEIKPKQDDQPLPLPPVQPANPYPLPQ